ncbi:MmyB family transcriptional regulator [Nocardiopsis akebiae]|uniref:MmyB family transcriptional regulator n=1 Tax=Nocardiopsis akebiae TaxID=2831968 RepID=UPI002016860F|nr:hypothetical protein [Nocardiopsis akebiae]
MRPVPIDLLALLDSRQEAGAIVLGPVLDVIAVNHRARDPFRGFTDTANLLEMAMLDPEGPRFFVGWEAAAEATVANLRASADSSRTPARPTELLETLRSGSPAFPELWAGHDVQPKTHETKLLRRPERGPPKVDFHAFNVASAPGYRLLVYQERGRAS